MNCLICRNEAVYGDLCKDCWVGLARFKRDTKLLGRAISYLGSRKKTLRTKRDRRKLRKHHVEVKQLVEQQRADANDREIRFEHAIASAEDRGKVAARNPNRRGASKPVDDSDCPF